MINPKQHHRAIKYVWNPEWIGKSAFDSEVKAAKAACIADIVEEWAYDQDIHPTEAQEKLTVQHIAKYASCKVELHIDRCYSKVIVEIDL